MTEKKQVRNKPKRIILQSIIALLYNFIFECTMPLVVTFNTNLSGAEEDRTPDLFDANEALSQLSYSPLKSLENFIYSANNNYKQL